LLTSVNINIKNLASRGRRSQDEIAQSEAPRRKISRGQSHCPLLSPTVAISTLSPRVVAVLMQTEMSTTPVQADANGASVPAIALQTTPISLHSYTKQNGHQNKNSLDLIPIHLKRHWQGSRIIAYAALNLAVCTAYSTCSAYF
jgi:hypothetical protein